MNKSAVPLFLLALTLLLPNLVKGHNVHVFAYIENDMIKGEGTLADGRKVKNGEIKVLHKDSQNLLLDITTDDNGQFGFAINRLGLQEPADLIIVLEAGPGHRSEWRLKAAEYETVATVPTRSNKQSEQRAERTGGPPSSSNVKSAVIGVSCIVGLGALIAWSRKRRGKA